MADSTTDGIRSPNAEMRGKTPLSESKKDDAPSSGLIAPSRLGNPFLSKSPQPPQGENLFDGVTSNRFSAFGSTLFGKPGNSSSATQEGASATKSLILRPSALDKQTASFSSPASAERDVSSSNSFKTSFKLEPEIINPFAKSVEDKDDSKVEKANPANVEESNGWLKDVKPKDSLDKKEPAMPFPNAPSKGSCGSEDVAAQTTPSKNGPPESGTAFVFGENMADRVVSTPGGKASVLSDDDHADDDEQKEASKAEEGSPGVASLPPTDDIQTPPSADKPTDESLAQSAAQEQAKMAKPEYQEVEVVTGEEDESNVFQINTKLYVFDKETQSWLERGRGKLRLNDMSIDDSSDSFQSRLVMRSGGNLRVVLNSKVWPAMTIERASPKSIRLTAIDLDNTIKVFLIMTGVKDADQIYSAIDWRIQQLKLSSRPVPASDTNRSSPGSTGPGPCGEDQANLKRGRDDGDSGTPPKKQRLDGTDESSVDPETEVSNESFASSTRELSSDA